MTSRLLRKPLITLSSNPDGLVRLALCGRVYLRFSGALILGLFLVSTLCPAGDPVRERTLGEAWQAHLDEVFEGLHDWSSFESAGDFWSRQNALQARSGALVLRKPVSEIVAENTWEQAPEPLVDIYETRSAAVLGAEVLQVSQSQEVRSDEPETSQRLKTDIRTIKPSLSYALREIEASQLPVDYDSRLDKGEYVARTPSPAVLQWAPTNFYHYPLYFEDPALERYGHTYHPLVQPFVSTGRFAGQLVGLPYQMVLNPVHSRQYALGYYRPGEVAPKKYYQIPWNNEAVVMQTAFVAGLFLILP